MELLSSSVAGQESSPAPSTEDNNAKQTIDKLQANTHKLHVQTPFFLILSFFLASYIFIKYIDIW